MERFDISSDEPVLDAEYLTSQTGGDPALTRIILETALAEVPVNRAEVEAAVSDPEAVAVPAHRLKGMMGMLGARRASKLAGAVEAAGRAGDRDELQSLVPRLTTELDRLVELIESSMDELVSS